MRGSRYFLAAVIAVLSASTLEKVAGADCVLYSLEQEFGASAAVFEGRVIAVEWIPGRECCHTLSGWATFETDRWWKGKPSARLRIGASGQIFNVGERYIVFAFGKPLVADGCNNTDLVKDSAKTLAWLAKKPSRRAG